jgi:hypothetical protein
MRKLLIVGALLLVPAAAHAQSQSLLDGTVHDCSQTLGQRTNDLDVGKAIWQVHTILCTNPRSTEAMTCGQQSTTGPWQCRVEWYYDGGPVGIHVYYSQTAAGAWTVNNWAVETVAH